MRTFFIEIYALKPFALGAFFMWFVMRKVRKYNDPKTFEIREI